MSASADGQAAPFVPVRQAEVELSEGLAALDRTETASGVPFGRAEVLVRLHGAPLGLVDVAFDGGSVPAAALATAIDVALAGSIAKHLAGDLLDGDASLLPLAIGSVDRPPCLEARRAVLAAPPSVSVVVPTIDRPEALRRCLEGLRAQTYPEFEIVVVDNAPEASGAAEVVAGMTLPGMRRVVEPERGTSCARNRGIREARGDIVAFLDGDVRPDAAWLAELVTALTTALPSGRPPTAVTGAILPSDLETEPQLWLEMWGGYAKGFDRRTFDLAHRREVGPLFPFAIAVCGSGASMALRRADVRALGGFDPALGGGSPSASGEDLALLLDVVSAGGTIEYEPAAIVWHEHPRTEDRFRATLHAYGIGLTSYLIRHLAKHPRDVIRLAAALPAAAAYIASSGKARNPRRSGSLPRGIWRDEVGGMALGPLAYARGRARRSRARDTCLDVAT